MLAASPPSGETLMMSIASVLDSYRGISLEEVGAASLMNRIDRKFLIPGAALPDILEGLSDQYRALDGEGRRLSRYRTRYFDTPELMLYKAHHTGRSRRYKVRVRSYADTGHDFLEVKLRTNHGRTLKQRVRLDNDLFGPIEQLKKDPMLGIGDCVAAASLAETMLVEYTRITLVRNDCAERITLDLLVAFSRGGERRCYDGAVIAEVKQAERAHSPFVDAMRARNVREGSLSKYCAGMAILDPRAKSNRFRPLLKRLEIIGASAQRAG